jgi:lipopolysaccharide transport system permease protein
MAVVRRVRPLRTGGRRDRRRGLGDLYLNVDPELLLALPAVLLCVAVVLGVGLWTSVLGASTRDMRFTVRYATGFIYFLTPVVYPLSAVPDQFEPIVAWNPLTPIVEMFRLALFGSGEVQTGPLILCVGLIAAFWAGGLAFYSRWEAGAVDRL